MWLLLNRRKICCLSQKNRRSTAGLSSCVFILITVSPKAHVIVHFFFLLSRRSEIIFSSVAEKLENRRLFGRDLNLNKLIFVIKEVRGPGPRIGYYAIPLCRSTYLFWSWLSMNIYPIFMFLPINNCFWRHSFESAVCWCHCCVNVALTDDVFGPLPVNVVFYCICASR